MATQAVRQALSRENLPSTLAAAGILFAALSILTPWFSLANVVGGTNDPLFEYGLSESVEHKDDATRTVVPYDSRGCDCRAVAGVFTQTQLLIWIGALLAAAAYWGRSWKRLKSDPAVALTAIAGLLMIAAPALLALNLPGAFLGDGNRVENTLPDRLWGSSFLGSSGISVSRAFYWGPGLAWVLALLAGGLTLASVLRERRRAVPAVAVASPSARPTGAPIAAPPAAPLPNGGALPSPASPHPPSSGGLS